MTRYLLDTTVISDFTRGVPAVCARLVAANPTELAMTTVTVMELEYGLELAGARAARWRPLMDGLLSTIEVLSYGVEDAKATAGIRVWLRKRGRPIGPYDALIAGTALSRGLILVTSNTGEFGRVAGLVVEDWRA